MQLTTLPKDFRSKSEKIPPNLKKNHSPVHVECSFDDPDETKNLSWDRELFAQSSEFFKNFFLQNVPVGWMNAVLTMPMIFPSRSEKFR